MEIFKKYNSINNHYNTGYINRVLNEYSDVFCYISEKVHGTNFSFIYEPNKPIKYAQRSMITDNIFNSKDNVYKVQDKIIKLGKYLNRPFQLYGEYYGDGIISNGEIKYFKENNNDFIFFDLRFIDTNEWCNHIDLNIYLSMFNIPKAPIVFEGTLKKCLSFDVDNFKSIVSENDVIAEGVVIKPIFNVIVGDERLIIKLITNQFRENKMNPYEQEIIKRKIEENRNNDLIREIIQSKDNDVRIGKVASRLGISNDEKEKFSELINEYSDDIITEVLNEFNLKINKKQVNTIVIKTIKLFFNIK